MVDRPQASEYVPYMERYISLVPDGELLALMSQQAKSTYDDLKRISEEQSYHRYAPDKWTIKEVVGHMADTERIFAYRMLCIARGEQASLPGFDENAYVGGGHFNKLAFDALVEELAGVRQSTISLCRTIHDEAWTRIGSANGNPISVRALAYSLLGHELHHLNIVKDRYQV